MTATDGTPLDTLEGALRRALDTVRADGITAAELRKAQRQLRARFVFEQDSITNIAHQLGFFATISSWRYVSGITNALDAVTLDGVARVAAMKLQPSDCVVGRFEPVEELPEPGPASPPA